MRPPRVQRSVLRYPLDDILGTSALVRLIRVLAYDVGGPVGVMDAARMAGLSTTGARKAFETLERLGVARRVGTGRAQKFGPREDSPYLPLVRRLFEEEQAQYEELMRQLRRSVAMPEVRDAWVRGLSDKSRRDVELDVVSETTALSWIGPELRARLIETERQFDVVVELNVFTRADSPSMPEDAISLSVSGKALHSERAAPATCLESAERSYRMAQAIAELIKSDPSLVRRALHHTERLLREDQGTATGDISEWRTLLQTYSPERLRDLLVSRSSRAERLRRSSPFFAVLTSEERDRVIRDAVSGT